LSEKDETSDVSAVRLPTPTCELNLCAKIWENAKEIHILYIKINGRREDRCVERDG
jgi:hypothetical protein